MQPRNTNPWLWYADKIFFGVALGMCALALVSFWKDAPRATEVPTLPAQAHLGLAPFQPPSFNEQTPNIAIDPATDPNEYLPGPGEHYCVDPDCIYIVPDGLVQCPECGAVQNDRDHDRMDDEFEESHAATDPDVPDGHLDYDRDKFTNKEEYDGGSNPDDPSSIPAPVKLVAVGHQYVDILFRGFYLRPSGERLIQLNWGQDTRTSILELGSSLHGYRLERLNEHLVKRGGQHGVEPYFEKEYELILRRPGGGQLVLPRNTPVPEPERYGTFVPSSGTPKHKIRAYAGMTFQMAGHSYVVMQVSPHGAHLTGDRGEHYNLELRPDRSR